jgi:hypothetical protein
MLALRTGERVRLILRRGLDWAIASRRSSQPSRHWARSCMIDGQMIACDDSVTLVA